MPLYPSPYVPDDELLVKIAPGSHKRFVRRPSDGGQRIDSEYNSRGFRGPELRARGAQTRVIVYGDSNVQAEFSALPDTFARRLQDELVRGGVSDPEVVNAGVVGYGPDQVSLRMAGDIASLRPTLVLVVLFADNDFGDLLRNRIYSLDGEGRLVRHRPRLSASEVAMLERGAHPQGLRRLQIWRHLRQLYLVVARSRDEPQSRESSADYLDAMLRLSAQTYRGYVRDVPGDGVAENHFGDSYDADLALEPDSPSAQVKVRLMEQVMLRMRQIARDSDTPLAFLILPAAIDVVDGYEIRVDAAKYPAYDRERLTRVLADVCVRGNLPCLNLYPELRARGAARYYFQNPDNHWNDAGQALAADLTARYLLAQSLLRQAAPRP